jgi:hypothetical protein
VILFDRAAGFLVSPPKIDAKLREVKWRSSQAGDAAFTDDDLPF